MTNEFNDSYNKLTRDHAEIAAVELNQGPGTLPMDKQINIIRKEIHNAIQKQLEEINTPEIQDFFVGVEREAKHQRLRWGSDHDEGKADVDWLWLLGWLAGKAVQADGYEKKLHHIITTAAACFNWHSASSGNNNTMRPGIGQPEGEKNNGNES